MSTLIQANGQSLIVPLVENSRRIHGFSTTDFNDPVHKSFNNVRSRLVVTQNHISESHRVETVDSALVENTSGQGIRISDERITKDRLSVGNRELVIQMNTSTQPASTSLTGFINFDTVVTPAFGITQQWLTAQIAANVTVQKIPVMVSGIYDIMVRINLAPFGSTDPNCFQKVYAIKSDQLSASQTALVDVLGLKSIIRQTSDAGANIVMEGTCVLRYDIQLDQNGNPVLDANGNPIREATSNDLSIFYSRNQLTHPLTVQFAEMRLKLLVAED